jgi:DNA polymerase elongation subunit (family B)
VILTQYDAWYTETDEGYQGTMPLVHLACRDQQRRPVTVTIEEFRPYFCVHLSDVLGDDELAADDRVLHVDPLADDRGVTGERLAKIVCERPRHVGQLRDRFDPTYEADVPFPERFLIDAKINHRLKVPSHAREERITPEDVFSGDDAHGEPVDPRIVTYDIEVQQSEDGPSVVSEKGTELAMNPITAIAAHDSYTDGYYVWVLAHDEWDAEMGTQLGDWRDGSDHVQQFTVHPTELELLESFVGWLTDRQPNVLQGWNSNSFDTPYLVNRCFEQDVYTIRDLSPTGDVHPMDGDGQWINSDLKGVVLFDLLDGYKKTQFHELDSYSLANVAAEETQYDKLAVGDIDEVWQEDPEQFVEYVLRDCQATVAINEEVGVV